MTGPGTAPRLRSLLLESLATGSASVAAAAVHLQLWRAESWRRPWLVFNDAIYYQTLVQGMLDHGTYRSNPSVGWPFGLDARDVPEGAENLHWLMLRLLGAIGGAAFALNVFYVLTFATTAAAAHAVLRVLGVRRLTAAVGGVLYAFAPYHFLRGQNHVFLSSYALVPVGVLVALWLLGPDPIRSWRDRRLLGAAAAMVALASTGAYYLVFCTVLIVVAGSVAALRDRRLTPVLGAGALGAVGAATATLHLAPSLWFWVTEGRNTSVVQRGVFETEDYGLRISQLFAPRDHHRIDALARLTEDARSTVLRGEFGQQLGLVGAIGLAAVLGVAVLAAAGRRSDGAPWPQLRRLAVLTVPLLVVATVSGLSLFASAAGLATFRAWNRTSIVLAFVGLAAVCLLLDALAARAPSRRILGVLPIAVLAVGLVDQTSAADVPRWHEQRTTGRSTAAFFRDLAGALGPGGTVWVMPHRVFPESGIDCYDGLIGYLYEPELRWSTGFMSGRHPEYPLALATRPPGARYDAVAAIGFQAVLLDRWLTVPVEAGETRPEVIEAATTAELGPPVAASQDGRYVWWDLRPRAASLRGRLGADATAALAAEALASTP